MQRFPFSRPPRALRRPGVRLDNVALVPASLLPFKREWQAVAYGLPKGSVLLCATTNCRQRHILKQVSTHMTGRTVFAAILTLYQTSNWYSPYLNTVVKY